MSPFKTDGFPARWYCGDWPEWLGWTHICSDIIIFISYQLIPVVALYYISRKKKVAFPPLFWLFGAFISFCGIGHLIEAIIFWHPVYPLAGYVKVLTAAVSAVTAFYCIRLIPKTLELPSVAESEEKHRLLFNAVPLSILEVDHKGTILLANNETVKFLSYSKKELIGQNISMLIPSRFREEHHHHFEKYCESPYEIKLQGRELLAKSKDGKEYFVEISITPSPTEGRLICSMLNINDRIISEKALDEKNRELDLMFSMGLIGYIRSTLNGEILEVNDYYCRLIGYSRDEVLSGLKWDEITPKESLEVEKEKLKGLDHSDIVEPYEKQYIRKDGQIVDLLIGVNLVDRDKGIAVCFVLNISDLKNRERDLTEAKAKLSKALEIQKEHQMDIENYLIELQRINEEKDDFVYTASHDLKEPLRAIYGLSSMVLHKIENEDIPEHVAKTLNNIATLSKRSRDQIDSLLSYSNIGAEKINITTFRLKNMLNEVIELFKFSVKEAKGKIEMNELPEFMTADRNLMIKVFENLISNSIKYSSDAPSIEIGSEERNGKIYFYVKDQGIGIEEENHDFVFKIFKSLDKKSGNSGVGLTIVKKIVLLHKGKIEVDSEFGKGTTISFCLGENL